MSHSGQLIVLDESGFREGDALLAQDRGDAVLEMP